MLTRLSAMTPVHTRGMWIGTFHGLCNRMLRAHYRDANLPQLFQIMDMQDQLALIKRLYKAHGINDERFPARQLQNFIAGEKEEGRRPNQVEASDEFTRRLVEHYALYEALCQREGVVDFAELLLRSYELLAGNEALREHYRRRFTDLLVDEFQDTNALQYKWLRLLVGAAHGGLRGRRRRPVDLRVSGRERRQHAALRARLRHRAASGDAYQARAELPLARAHPRRRQRAHQAQPDAPRQEPVDERRQGRAGARFRGAVGQRRGRIRGRGREGSCRRRRGALRDRRTLSVERPVASAGARAVQRGAALPRLRWHALFRARGSEARARISPPPRRVRRRRRAAARR